MKIGLDVDYTIMSHPDFFSMLSGSAREKGWEIHIVTTRPDTEFDRGRTLVDMSECNISYDTIHHLPKQEGEVEECPHEELDGYEKFVWQKVKYSLENNLDYFFDDDVTVVRMFKKFAPMIQVFQVCRHQE